MKRYQNLINWKMHQRLTIWTRSACRMSFNLRHAFISLRREKIRKKNINEIWGGVKRDIGNHFKVKVSNETYTRTRHQSKNMTEGAFLFCSDL